MVKHWLREKLNGDMHIELLIPVVSSKASTNQTHHIDHTIVVIGQREGDVQVLNFSRIKKMDESTTENLCKRLPKIELKSPMQLNIKHLALTIPLRSMRFHFYCWKSKRSTFEPCQKPIVLHHLESAINPLCWSSTKMKLHLAWVPNHHRSSPCSIHFNVGKGKPPWVIEFQLVILDTIQFGVCQDQYMQLKIFHHQH